MYTVYKLESRRWLCDVETDGVVHISHWQGEVDSIDIFGGFNLFHISAFILKCVLLFMKILLVFSE